jgi:transposase
MSGPKAIGIDKISIHKGPTYRIVLSDLVRDRPIWSGGNDRLETSTAMFYEALATGKSAGSRLAKMDMWKAPRKATQPLAPWAAVLSDKFHIMSNVGQTHDEVCEAEHARFGDKDRRFIKRQQYTLLSHRESLSLDGRAALKQLLSVNKRLTTAYLLKESLCQLWDYRREAWGRCFFEQWRKSLSWQRLKLFEKFVEMIERHCDGIAVYRQPENNLSLGFVEGRNNKIRVIQRRAYGLRDEDNLRLKVLTCMLPEL